MAAPRQIAVLDVGKTNVKVAVVDRPGRREIAVETTPNIVRRDGPYPHYDVAHLWAFFEDAITRLARVHAIDGISITAHGASIVLLGDDELALPVLDYEYDGPDALTSEYNALRPDFAETQSPRLPGGLTVGAQIHWLEHSFPDGFARTRFILTYPQYWAWRLTGIATNEVTSLGCHTDLWQPAARTWSSLVEKTGWGRLMAPVHDATVPLGPLKQALARRWGLADDMPVACGIHDSNASLLPHLLDHTPPFTAVSTGTWAISFAVGATAQRLDPDRDTLANVNVFGDPVPSARFMGGREFELMTEDAPVPIDASAIDRVLEQGIMVLPAVVPESGPFQGRTARWSHDPSTLSPALRTAAAGLYLACMTQTCFGLIGARGPVIVEGPFAGNGLYCNALASLTGQGVRASTDSATGTSVGAALLFEAAAATADKSPPLPSADGLEEGRAEAVALYAARWREAVEEA